MRTNTTWREIARNRYLYLLILPALLFYAVFCYAPLSGIQLAFKSFRYDAGIWGSPWVGLANFKSIFALQDFWAAFRNTITISLQRLVIEFPIPILLAIMLNEIQALRLKRFYQTVLTFPHFLSWIVVSGIVVGLVGSAGVGSQLAVVLGGEKLDWISNPAVFRFLLYATSIWKSAGYSSIIYLAAIAGISPELYEAAHVDGAGRFRQMLHVTWPGIQSTAAIMLILAVGQIMNAGFDQILNLYNPAVYGTADIIDTFLFRRTFQLGADFGSSTAVGLFKSVLNVTLLLLANYGAKKLGEEGLI